MAPAAGENVVVVIIIITKKNMNENNYIDHTDLFCDLRDRAQRRGLRHLLYRCELQGRRNERCLDSVRETLCRICIDLRAPVPPPKGEWAQGVGAEIPDHELEDREKHNLYASGLRARQKSEDEGRGLRSDPGGVQGSGRQTAGRKNQSEG